MASSPKVVSILAGDRAGVLQRRDALVESHLDLVRQIARGFAASLPSSFELDDLIGAGNLGLLRAATNYDPRRHNDTPFSAYARPVILGAMRDSVRRGEWDWHENTRSNVVEMPERAYTPEMEAFLDRVRDAERVQRAVAVLDERSRAVVDGYYGEEMRLPAVGERLGVGKSRASQLHVAAIRELRAELASV